MKRLTRTLPLFLAAALQLLPLLRNIVTVPSAGSSFAIILRWGIGSAAALGAYDACSGATSGAPIFASPTNFFGTVGTYFTNNVVITNVGTDPGGYFILYNSNLTVVSGHISNNIVTTNCMPNGLSFKCLDYYSKNPPYIIGSIYGTSAVAVTNLFVHIQAGHPAAPGVIDTTNYFTIYPAVSGSPPTITNQPISLTNNVGSNITFTVTNGGTAPFTYKWYFNTNTILPNQTNASVTLTNVQLTNSGTYSVAITNAAGGTNSSFALLTVWQPPVITNQSVGITNVAGGNATFSVTAGGVPTPGYQWKFNTNMTLLNSTNTALPLTGIRASQAGIYNVVITNSAGSVTSTIASLVITNPLPPPITAPVTTAGGGSFQFNFTTIPGLTNTVLTNGALAGGTWNVYTNIPPTATPVPITIFDSPGSPARFYRVQVLP